MYIVLCFNNKIKVIYISIFPYKQRQMYITENAIIQLYVCLFFLIIEDRYTHLKITFIQNFLVLTQNAAYSKLYL